MLATFIYTLIMLNGIALPSTGCNVTWPTSTTNAIFYITPTASSPNPDCPSTDDQHCVTLDEFTKYKLPNIKTSKITLIFSKDIHNSTMPINFANFQQVTLCGNWNSTTNIAQPPDQAPLIQLLSGNITVTSADESPLSLEVVHLAINGSGKYTLAVTVSINSGGLIFVSQAKIFDIVFQIINGFKCPNITISDTSFLASMIEIYGCVVNGQTNITNSTFSSGQQPYTIAICPPVQSDSDPGRSRSRYAMVSDNTLLQITLDRVNITDLNDPHLPIPKIPSLCNGTLQATKYHPTDIDVHVEQIDLNIMNSYFNRSYGTAFQPQYREFNLTISNSIFTGYTQGVLIFNGDLQSVKINLINTTFANNNISTGETIRAAVALSIIPNNDYFLENFFVEVSGCSFERNVDTVGNLQVIKLHGVTNIMISDTNFINNNSTAIDADQSNITFSGNITFHRNQAWQAGALSLKATTMTIAENANVVFSNNSATHFGGAIFIDDPLFYLQNDKSSVLTFCFYQPLHPHYTKSFGNAKVKFLNNSAGKGGDHIYGTSIRNYCRVYVEQHIAQLNNWNTLFDIDRPNTSISHISSKAMRVCLCDPDGKRPLCDESSKIFSVYRDNRTVYPGEEFSISAAVVGAEFGATVGEVYAKLLNASPSASLRLQNSQQIYVISNSHQCTQLKYSINSNNTNSHEIIYLTSNDVTLKYYGNKDEISKSIQNYSVTQVIPSYSLLTTPVFINVSLSPCPRGFALVGNSLYCDCRPELKQHSVSCLFKNGTGYISRKNNNWVGVHKNGTKGVLFGSHCPLDYCIQHEVCVNLEAEKGSDDQCARHHAGILCGCCKKGYSVAIGSNHCLNCTTNNNMALLLFFAAAGPLLYVVIAALDLTITKGSINGLIFYANIVWVYQYVIFTSSNDNASNTPVYEVTYYAFKVFIAWLNLDFGIETCFIKGLDAFWKSLLQYLFPLYLWFIAWLVNMIYNRVPVQKFEERYPQLSRIAGKPVDVLSTFIFLSYTKLLRTIVAAFSYALLQHYPQNTTEKVWAIDGSVSYLSGKHIIVFILALLSLIATLLYTLYMLVIGLQTCEYSCRNNDYDHESGQLMGWCKRLFDMPLPLRDAHFLPLKDKHRYWFGLLLLVRSILLVIFSVTYTIYSRPNLLILLITASILLIYMGWKKVYNKESVWMLQALSIGNLICLSGGILYIKQSIIVYVSIGIAFVQFLGIVGYHIVQVCLKKQHTTTEQAEPTSTVMPTNEEEPQDPNGFRESLLLGDESNPLINTRLMPSDSTQKVMLPCLNCCKKQQ